MPIAPRVTGPALVLLGLALAGLGHAQSPTPAAPYTGVSYHTVKIEGVKVFYREAGSPAHPTLVLLHGFPSSSHMFRDLIPKLEGRYHIVAPDYPGFGNSDQPAPAKFAYTFDHLSKVVDELLVGLKVNRYSLYIQDYGSPVGLRLALKHPERVQAIVTQNGNAYEEGLSPFWNTLRPFWRDRAAATARPLLPFFARPTTVYQYTSGYRHPERVSPDAVNADQLGLDRPGNNEVQLDLFYDYRTNVALYPAFHAYFRKYQPPLLAVWGKNDPFFTPAGATAYARDLKDVEVHLLDTGHFALEEDGDLIAGLMLRFLDRHVVR